MISCSDVNLEKNVVGKDLTVEFCIDLVRNQWDCNMGAVFANNYNHIVYEYGCAQGDMGKVINWINGFFEDGIDLENSYYRNYVLHLQDARNDDKHFTVNF